MGARWCRALWVVLLLLLLLTTRTAAATGASIEVAAEDGRTWRELLRDIQSDPRTAGREYGLTVKTRGESVRCGEYTLSLDAVAKDAFALGACDERTGVTPITVVDRASLFSPGGAVPEPRRASVQATLRQSATEWGGR